MEDERKKKIESILEQEIDDGEDLASEARKMIEYLLVEKKGYSADEVGKNFVYDVNLDQEKLQSSVDFLVTVEGRKAMIIKCASGSISSRERQAVAAARIIDVPPVPLAVVSDPGNAEVLSAITGKVIGEGFGAIPLREEIVSFLSAIETKPLSPERIEKEKRILLAFDAIKCCVPQGEGGGVQIGPAPNDEKKCLR